jgi:hypothetical protein
MVPVHSRPTREKGKSMAEKTILVCDACGRPAAETVTIRVGRGNFVKDLCSTHVAEMIAGARRPRPGRRKGVVSSPAARTAGPAKRRGRPRKKASARKSSARKPSARKPGARKAA